MTHLSSTLPDRIEIGAVRHEEWRTEIIGSDSGAEVRSPRWTESLRSYDVKLPVTARDDVNYLAARQLYADAKGTLHSFNFKDWSDDEVIAVRFDGPLMLTGLTPDFPTQSGYDQLSFSLVEVK